MNIDPATSTSNGFFEVMPSRTRIRIGLITAIMGFLVFLIGAKPEFFGLDRSPVVGFIQIAVFLIGLALMCVGGYVCLNAFWRNGQKSIAADVGLRLVSTGFVIAVFAGMADIFGMGTQPLPGVPHFGYWQAIGVEIGQGLIALGLLLFTPITVKRIIKEGQ